MLEAVFSSDLFDRAKAFHQVRTCVVIGDTSPHTQSEVSSVHTDMHSAGNNTEIVENDRRNVRTCRIKQMMQNIPDTHEITSPKHIG